MEADQQEQWNKLAFNTSWRFLYFWPRALLPKNRLAIWIFSTPRLVQLLFQCWKSKESYSSWRWSLILFIQVPWLDLQRFSLDFEHRYSEASNDSAQTNTAGNMFRPQRTKD